MTNQVEIIFSLKTVNQEKVIQAVRPDLSSKIEVFNHYSIHNLQGKEHRRLSLSNKERVNFLFDYSYGEVENLPVTIKTISGQNYVLEGLLMKDETAKAIQYAGETIAYYDAENRAIYVPYSIKDLDEDAQTDICITVVKAFYDSELAHLRHPNSWIGSRERLKEDVDKALRSTLEADIKREKDRIASAESSIRQYTQSIKEQIDAKKNFTRNLFSLENAEENYENFYNGLDQISKHPGVTEVLVENELIKVHVAEVYMHADLRGKTRKYYTGNMIIQMNVGNTDIRFFGDNPRKSYWTSKDPHPHVDGSNGGACLGTAGPAIAELCAQKEVYALFLICLDFLQNANTSDAAGRRVINWDEVNEHNIVIRKGSENYSSFKCEFTGKEFHTKDMSKYTVYETASKARGVNKQTWSEQAADEHATFDKDLGIFVAKQPFAVEVQGPEVQANEATPIQQEGSSAV